MIRKILILLALVSIWQGCEQFNKQTVYTNSIDSLINDKEVKAFEDSITIATLERIKTEQEITIDSLNALLNSKGNSSGLKYYMVVGSFQNADYAKKWEAKIASKGYETNIVEGRERNFYYVTAKTYYNLRNAINDLDSYRESMGINSWILIKK